MPAILPAQQLTGSIHVVDGDTLRLGAETIRLFGIDAPEADQMCGGQGAPLWPCGAWVTGEVRARYDSRRAACTLLDRDRYGRAVARCDVAGEDLGRALVQAGLAFAYRRYSMDYDLDEKTAAVTGRGLHGTGVQSPAAFRAAKRQHQDATEAPRADRPAGCAIKGNLSSDGKRIYHLPGQRWYAETTIRTDRGERWFCSEAEARAAGWRRARN